MVEAVGVTDEISVLVDVGKAVEVAPLCKAGNIERKGSPAAWAEKTPSNPRNTIPRINIPNRREPLFFLRTTLLAT